MVKYEASTAVGLTLIVTFVIKRAEESLDVETQALCRGSIVAGR